MAAVEIRRPGGPEELQFTTLPLPQVPPNHLMIQVAAAGVNRPDVFQRLGAYPPPPGASPIPGLEVSGRVVVLGEGTRRYKLLDAVCALVPGGGYAEYCVVHESNVLPVPEGLSLVAAAALPETYFTVWVNLFGRAALEAGETVLVHGGASGIGTVSIMLAKAFGAKVFCTAGSEEKCDAARALGADAAINYRTQDFVEETKRLTDGRGVDVIVDLIAGDYVARNYQAAAVEGRIVQIGLQGGPMKNLDLMPLLAKRLTHTGSTLRSRSIEEKAAIARDLEAEVWPLLESGEVQPQIFQTFALRDAAKAHAAMEASLHIGKLVLLTDDYAELEVTPSIFQRDSER